MATKSKIVGKSICAKCSVSVKNCIVCAKCMKEYHPSCVIKVKRMHVDDDGRVICCGNLTSNVPKTCNCEQMELEIQHLKSRIFKLNESILDQTLLDIETVSLDDTDNSVDAAGGLEFELDGFAELRRELDEMKTLLSRQMFELQDLLTINKDFTSKQKSDNSNSLYVNNVCNRSMVPSVGHKQNSAAGDDTNVQRPTLLILGDSQCRSISSLLRRRFEDLYRVETVFKPNATFEQVTRDIGGLCRSLGDRDVVAIVAGTNNVLRGGYLNEDAVKSCFSVVRQTNVIMVSVPYFNFSYNYHQSKAVHRFNSNMCNIVAKYRHSNVQFLDVNELITRFDITPGGIHLTQGGKQKLCSLIADSILRDDGVEVDKLLYINYDNLKYVHVTSISDEEHYS